MRVIVIGAGKVGFQIAESLSRENFDVIVIDQDEKVIERVNDRLDVMAVQSNGLAGQSLKEIGLGENDLVIAVTESDEGNILACITAKTLGAGRTIARVRNPEYSKDLTMSKEQLSIDYIINPEKSTADEITRMLAYSPAGQVEDFARKKVQMIEIPVEETNPYINVPLKTVGAFTHFLIAAISRKGQIIIPKGNDELRVGDNIFVIGRKEDIIEFCRTIGKAPRKTKNVMILGGGKIAYYLAESLQAQGASVKIIERDAQKCKELAENLPTTLIINGDGSDIDLLKQENIGFMDAFIAITGMDEENILISLLAKQLGATKVISKISKLNYITVVETLGIDAAITPSMITTAEILRYVRGGRIKSLFLLLGGQAEAIEFIAQPDCPILNIPIRDIHFPKDVLVATIVHKGKVIIPHGDDIIQDHDRVIILSHASNVAKVSSLFSERGGKNKDGLWDRLSNSRPTING